MRFFVTGDFDVKKRVLKRMKLVLIASMIILVGLAIGAVVTGRGLKGGIGVASIMKGEAGSGASVSGKDGSQASSSHASGAGKTRRKASARNDKTAAVEPQRYRVRMVGDMLLHTTIIGACKVDSTASGGAETYDFTSLFTDTKELSQKADISILNQETILGGKSLNYSGYPAFNSPQEVGDAEADAGYNVILAATNHSLDRGVKGVKNTLEYWRTKHPNITVCGMHDSKEDEERIRVIEVDGAKTKGGAGSGKKSSAGTKAVERTSIKVAILNYTYGTNGFTEPSGQPYLVDNMTEEKVKADLAKARTMADFIIVCPHWGTEYVFKANDYQKKWAKIFVDNGANLIIGAHLHVIQPMEWIEGENGQKALCYYSLGNFVTGTARTGGGIWKQLVSGMADITLVRGADGKVTIEKGSVIPLICHWEKNEQKRTVFTVKELLKYTPEQASAHLINKQDKSFTLDRAKALVKEVWGIE